jgi:hypothetical protein
MPVFGALLVLAGLTGPVARVQWQRHQWLSSARWLVAHGSVHLVRAVPMAGLTISSVGLTLIWPAAIVLAMLTAVGFLVVLFGSARWNGARVRGSFSRVTFRHPRDA